MKNCQSFETTEHDLVPFFHFSLVEITSSWFHFLFVRKRKGVVVGIVSAKLVSYFTRRFIFRLSSFQFFKITEHEFVLLFIFPWSRLFLHGFHFLFVQRRKGVVVGMVSLSMEQPRKSNFLVPLMCSHTYHVGAPRTRPHEMCKKYCGQHHAFICLCELLLQYVLPVLGKHYISTFNAVRHYPLQFEAISLSIRNLLKQCPKQNEYISLLLPEQLFVQPMITFPTIHRT